MPKQNYVSIVAGFRAGGEEYKLGDPVPVAKIPGGRNLVEHNYVALDNSDEGIQATTRAEAMASASEARRELTPREEHEQTLRKLEEEAAPARMGKYDKPKSNIPNIPKGGPDIISEQERRILADLHKDAPKPQGKPRPDVDNTEVLTAEEDAAKLHELETAALEARIGERGDPNLATPGSAPPTESDVSEADIDATDEARDKAGELGVDLATVTGTGKDGRIKVVDVEKAAIDEDSEES